MDRDVAINKLNTLKGQVLQDLVPEYGVTLRTPSGTINKGWAGHVYEKFLGVSINSSQQPDFGDWELKSIPLKVIKNGDIRFKETMAITMINPEEVADTDFDNSHLLLKLQKLLVVARVVGKTVDDPSIFYSATSFDLTGSLYDEVKNDYDLVRRTIQDNKFSTLSGKMGKYIQPRTKGSGHGSTSRAFYARPKFLSQFIDLSQK